MNWFDILARTVVKTYIQWSDVADLAVALEQIPDNVIEDLEELLRRQPFSIGARILTNIRIRPYNGYDYVYMLNASRGERVITIEDMWPQSERETRVAALYKLLRHFFVKVGIGADLKELFDL